MVLVCMFDLSVAVLAKTIKSAAAISLWFPPAITRFYYVFTIICQYALRSGRFITPMLPVALNYKYFIFATQTERFQNCFGRRSELIPVHLCVQAWCKMRGRIIILWKALLCGWFTEPKVAS